MATCGWAALIANVWVQLRRTNPTLAALQGIAGTATLAVLGDKSARPVYPRWLGYAGLWVAALLLPGTILVYFLDGPFAYDGLVSYWIPVFAFGGWLALLALATFLAAQDAGPDRADAAPPETAPLAPRNLTVTVQ